MNDQFQFKKSPGGRLYGDEIPKFILYLNLIFITDFQIDTDHK